MSTPVLSGVPPGALLATKLRAPLLRRRIVARDRLVDRLVAGQSGRLALVSAPAGWGKTTLVLEWCRRQGGEPPVAWVSLDADDADPVRFWAYVVRALADAVPGRLTEPLRLVSTAADLRFVVLPSLVNALAAPPSAPVVLVLDDYHAASSAPVDDLLGYFLDVMPPCVHVIVLSRVRPALPLARLRSRGELTELRAADLRFSRAEAAYLFTDVLGLRLTPAEVTALQQRTEGWVAALHLAALSLRLRAEPPGLGRPQPREHLVQYLAAEVLAGLPPDLRAFVQRTSILERLCPALCDAVTGRGDGREMLAEVDRNNLFLIALDDRHEWFRYHHLFAELLRGELVRSEPELVGELHRRAARWLGEAGAASEAIRHALLADDLAAARQLISRHWNSAYNRGRLATVGGWLDALGDGVVRGDPWLAAGRVLVLADEGRLDELQAWLEADRDVGVDDYPYAVLRALVRFKCGDLTAAEEALLRAAELRSESEPFWPTVERCVTAAVRYWSGDLVGARTAAAAAATLARSYGNVAGHTYATGYLVVAALDDDDVPTAQRRLTDIADQLLPGSDLSAHFVLTLPLLAAGQLAIHAGRADEGLAALHRSVALGRRAAGRLERIAALTALAQARETAGDRAAAGSLRMEASAVLRACADPRRAAALLAAKPAPTRLRTPAEQPLTQREAAVLRLLPSQRSLRDIGEELFVSHNTVKTHVRTLYRKLAASSRDEAVHNARRAGLL